MCLTVEAKAVRMMKRGLYEQAAEMLAGNPGACGRAYASRRNLMAVCKAKMGEFAEAKSILSELNSDYPGDPRVLNNLGNVVLLEGNPQDALRLYKQAAALSPWASEPRFNMCLAYRKLGKIENSLSSYHEYVLVRRMNRLAKALMLLAAAALAAALIYH